MSVWIDIAHAPKDRPVDLWGAPHAPEHSKRLMMVHAIYMRRWADCQWSPRTLRSSGLLMNLPDGWYFKRVHGMELRDENELNWQRIWPTHYMEIPEGPR